MPELAARLKLLIVPVVFLALVAAWELLTLHPASRFTLWPAPSVILTNIWDERDLFIPAAATTLWEAFLGFVAGVFLALLTGALSLRFRVLSDFAYRTSVVLYAVPVITIAPILDIWFGQTLTPKIIIASLGAFFPVTANTLLGLRSANRTALEMMDVLGASRRQTLQYVRIPFALPLVLASFKIAAPAALIGAMISEWSGATQGLGIMLIYSMFDYLLPRLWGTLLIASLLSVVAYSMFDLAARVMLPWSASMQRRGAVR
jgi:ABC-type nitrate/sulfonate/bicarbonate transport system permease component